MEKWEKNIIIEFIENQMILQSS